MLIARYGVGDPGGWRLGDSATRARSSVVKALMKIGSGEGKAREAFRRGVRLLVGNGRRVLF